MDYETERAIKILDEKLNIIFEMLAENNWNAAAWRGRWENARYVR